MSVAVFAAVVHLVSDFEYFTDAVRSQMRASLHQRDDLLKLRKVSFLLGREEWESFKERNHIFYDGVEVRHLEIPNAVRPTAKSSTA